MSFIDIIQTLHKRLTILEAHFNATFPMHHPISEPDKEIFLSMCDETVREAMRKLIDNTIHVSMEKLVYYLNRNINEMFQLYPSNKVFYLFLDTSYEDHKFKSNYWIATFFMDLISSKKDKADIEFKFINSLDFPELKNGDVVVFLDDCVYSGQQMGLTLEYLKNPRNLNLQIFILIPFITQTGLDVIQKVFDNNDKISTNCNLVFCTDRFLVQSNVDNFLSQEEILKVNNMYSNYCRVNDRYLIYFDHKIADDVSTISLIYSGLVASQFNREKLQDLQTIKLSRYRRSEKEIVQDEILRSQLIDQLQYHCFIDKCQGFKSFDVQRPQYPAPPYKDKEKFQKFVSEVHTRLMKDHVYALTYQMRN